MNEGEAPESGLRQKARVAPKPVCFASDPLHLESAMSKTVMGKAWSRLKLATSS
jgi:hypothetical protein